MALRFRRSFKIVPGVRLNLSGKGASVSLGSRGFHYTIGQQGTRTTVGLPGSGVSWTTYQPYPRRNNSSVPDHRMGHVDKSISDEPTGAGGDATVFDSAPIDQLVANSTIAIAGALNEGRSRWRTYKLLLALLAASFVFAGVMAASSSLSSVPPMAAFLVVAGAVIIFSAIAIHGREISTVSLDYELSAEEAERFKSLTSSFDALAGCSRTWRVPLERAQTDWKRNAGASTTVERKRISLGRSTLPLVKSNVEFLKFPLGKETVYLAPDAILLVAGNSIAAFGYDDVEVQSRPTRFIEDDTAPGDAAVVGETWRYVNRKGGPDRRFNNNRKLPICLYGEIDLTSTSGLKERIHCSGVEQARGFQSAFTAMRVSPGVAGLNGSSPPPLPVS